MRNSARVAPEVTSMFIGTMGIFAHGFSFTPSVLFLGVRVFYFLWQNGN
jgi:hypothetical protein